MNGKVDRLAARSDQVRQLSADESPQLVVVQIGQLWLASAADKHAKQCMIVRCTSWELYACKTNGDNRAACDLRYYDSKRIQWVLDLLPPKSNAGDNDTGVFDGTESR